MAIVGLTVALVIVTMGIQPSLSVPLSYEAQDTVLDLMSEQGFTGLKYANLNETPRALYRKDLGSNSIAYYEIVSGDGTEYFLLSAGPKTGDYRFVENGAINSTAGQRRPTDALNIQARLNRRSCAKYYRLSQAGIDMCEDDRGNPVAATSNWTSNAPVGVLLFSY